MPSGADKCAKIRAKLASCMAKTGKAVDVKATGTKCNNLLLDALQCEAAAEKRCTDAAKRYASCHKSFMGQGLLKAGLTASWSWLPCRAAWTLGKLHEMQCPYTCTTY